MGYSNQLRAGAANALVGWVGLNGYSNQLRAGAATALVGWVGLNGVQQPTESRGS